ncbi:conserved hypothetical protein [Candidatus Desulfosporosinus infrequens]|uniref:Uncharacterized protein n=1 Tax=Candidatus Desulfosporosinus infrequens TaxID=2043169 RepID=A0A2U3KY81_9FIRM|nr:conserved hypothetical protein [Candidatus Desulfosporosinus infrequens]
MALLTTGLFENTAVSGVRPSSTLTVRISNDDTISETIHIVGFFQSGSTKVQYVDELLSLAAGEVALRNYYAQFDAFEFQFTISSLAVNVSAWGKDAAGNLTTAHRVVAEEVNLF